MLHAVRIVWAPVAVLRRSRRLHRCGFSILVSVLLLLPLMLLFPLFHLSTLSHRQHERA